jgi:formylmethanofuran:tetrahydromethanopterin formyltransferase
MFATEGTALAIEIIIGMSTILAGIAASIKWLTKHYFDEIKSELKPNSGSSMKDQVTRLEEKVNIIYDIVIKNKN